MGLLWAVDPGIGHVSHGAEGVEGCDELVLGERLCRGKRPEVRRQGLQSGGKWFRVGNRGSDPGASTMFLGEYEHSIDDKSRLTLPARFRDALADGVVLSKGLDGSVDVYPQATWKVTVVGAHRRSSTRCCPTRGTLQRHFFGGASEDAPDKQGRVHPARRRSLRYGKLAKDVTVVGSNDHLEIWDRAAWAERLEADRRERRQCCRTSCRTARLITPPFSPTRCASFSPCSPGETVVDATFGAGRPRALLARGAARRRQARRDRPRPEREAVLRPVQGAAPASTSRFLRGDFAVVLAPARRERGSRPTRSCSTSASRRCRSTGPSAASPTRPTRRSTCAWTPRPS